MHWQISSLQHLQAKAIELDKVATTSLSGRSEFTERVPRRGNTPPKSVELNRVVPARGRMELNQDLHKRRLSAQLAGFHAVLGADNHLRFAQTRLCDTADSSPRLYRYSR